MVVREQLDHKKRADLTSLKIWREKYTDLSIQDIHTFNHERGGKGPHNSQEHKLENNTIDPYLQVFKSLAGMFHELANEENFIYVKSEKLRKRLKNAQPYLTHDGRVPTMIDLIEIFEGIQPVNSLYAQPEKITDDLLDEFSKALASTFRWVGTQNMTNNKETWNDIQKTQSIKRVEEKELLDVATSVLIGDKKLSAEQVKFTLTKYKECPMVCAYRSLVDQPLPEELENAHSKLLELVAK
jgi:hypothetical protein